MYNEIASNKRKTVFLMFLVVVVLLGFGWAYGQYTGDVVGGLALAAILSLGGNVVGYFASDKIALASAGAKQITAADHPELWRLVENLSITAGTPMPKIAIIQDAALNAFATGRNPEHAVIAVTTGLLAALDRTELEGVLAHELSHIRNYDILLMTVVVVLIGTIVLLGDLFRWGGLSSSRDRREGGGIGVVIALVLLIAAPLVGQLIKLAISRKREYLADASGALLTRYPEGLASALEKISADTTPLRRASQATAHLFISNPFRQVAASKLLSTHPPVADRIARLRSM